MSEVDQITQGEALFPQEELECLGTQMPRSLTYRGSLEILTSPRNVAFFCSRKCPGARATLAYDIAQKLRDAGHQGRLANAVLAGLRKYFYINPPPDTQIAANLRQSPARQVRHVISSGDTLSEIAERYNVSAAAIRAANKLSTDNIRVGQTLSIPVFAGG